MKYHFLPPSRMSVGATALASIWVVLQMRNTFQWQLLPVTASVCPPGTTCSTPFSLLTSAIASESAEFTLPSRKFTLSRSINLRAFCTAVPASPLVESSERNWTCRPRIPPLAFICSTASAAPISSFLPTAANVPVSGLSRPIFTGSSPRAEMMKGPVSCRAPAAAAALITVRRLTFLSSTVLSDMRFLLVMAFANLNPLTQTAKTSTQRSAAFTPNAIGTFYRDATFFGASALSPPGEDRFHLVHDAVHPGGDRVVGGAGGHVDPGLLHQLVGVVRGAGGDEAAVFLQRPRLAFQYPVGKERRGRDRRRVLEDVEVVVEVRDVGPFDAVQVVDLHHPLGLAVIAAQDLAVDLREVGAREGVAAVGDLVDLLLELPEHRLPEEGAAQVLQRRAQEEQPFVVVLRVLQRVVEEQVLVHRRCDLGDEGRVVRVGVGLRPVRVERMHRVAPLVGHARHRFVVPDEVLQHVRVRVVRGPRHVRARLLVGPRIDIHPAAVH